MFAGADDSPVSLSLERTSEQRESLAHVRDLALEQKILAFRCRPEVRYAEDAAYTTVDPEAWRPKRLHGDTGTHVEGRRLETAMQITAAILRQQISVRL